MLEFREQPGGDLWKANRVVQGDLFEWSITKSAKVFDTALHVNGEFHGQQFAKTFKNAKKVAQELLDDYFKYREDE